MEKGEDIGGKQPVHRFIYVMFRRFGDHPQGRERRNEEGEVAVWQVEGCGREL